MILTLFNLNKAFHIDDTFHLEAALQIAQDPLHPMSGLVNWNDTPHRISVYNQPPLFFFLIAGVGSVFGFSEVPLHLLLSVFTLLALIYFQKLTDLLLAKSPRVLLLLFAFCPALLVNQNLMVDVPLLACLMGATYFMLKGIKTNKLKYFIGSMLWFSAGMLIKYSILPFAPTFILVLLLNRRFKGLLLILIPIVAMLGFSWWNYLEYGAMHFFDRPVHQLDFDQFTNFIACLGALAPFIFSLVYGSFSFKGVKYLLWLIGISLILIIPLSYLGGVSIDQVNSWLTPVFLTTGYLTIGLLLFDALKNLVKHKAIQSVEFTLLILFLGFTLFVIISPQFMASRHLLLVIPFIILLAHRLIGKAEGAMNWVSIFSAAALTIGMGISDWLYADYYRTMAAKVAASHSGKNWALGHWGWQWYAQQEGMKVYDSKREIAIGIGDYLSFPVHVPKQPISDKIKFEVVGKYFAEPGVGWFISGSNASFYNSSVNKPLWSLSRIPIDTVYVGKVIDDISIEDIKLAMRSDPTWLTSMEQKALDRNLPLDSMLYIDAKWLKDRALRE